MCKKKFLLGLHNWRIVITLPHLIMRLSVKNNLTLTQMKKFFVIVASVFFVSAIVTSCRSHERCAAYGKINKIDTGKSHTNKTEKSI